MKKTKTAKKINVVWIKITSFISEYDCPSCKTRFRGSLSKHIIRFLCDQCGQELIINNNELENDNK